jgi:uncharacterized cupredoxin-like copper-binding protein
MRKALLIPAVCALVVVPLASGAGTATSVTVTAKEFTLVPSVKSVKAGAVTFTMRNAGKVAHEMIVLKTSKAPGSLAGTGSSASEKGSLGEISGIKPGKSGKLTLTLKPGKYVLFCNLPGHYKSGQFTGFTVK